VQAEKASETGFEPCRWQEERRKHFPSETNLAKQAEEAKARAERGDLDPETQQKRRKLHDVLQLQRQLGLAKAAGTETMQMEGGDDGGAQGQGTVPYDAFVEASVLELRRSQTTSRNSSKARIAHKIEIRASGG